jgi:DNA-binding MarR family transcriptional regulator
MKFDNDEVDAIIDAWAQHLPEVDFTPLDVMSRLRRVNHQLNEIRREAFRSTGLEIWEFDVLAALRRAPAPHELSPSQLMEATMIGSAAMTNRLDNLTKRELISRRPNPVDARSNLARLTVDGTDRVDRAMVGLVEREAVVLKALTREQQAALAEMLRVLGTR